jgi:cobalt/nickel transport protein
MNTRTKNTLLVAGTVALAVFALAFSRPATGEAFGGSDDQAREAISQVAPNYKAWAKPLWEPPSGEIESLIFGIQAAAGAGVLCYALGYWRGRRSSGRSDAQA